MTDNEINRTDDSKIIESSAVEKSSAGEKRHSKRQIVEMEETLAALKTELEQERDKRLRLMAEYDNFRRRTQSEYRQIIQNACERIMGKLLPALDDFERFLKQDAAKTDPSTLRQGLELIYKKLDALLESEGVRKVEAVGKPFDSGVHEAVAQLDDPSQPPGHVLAEAEKGYKLGEKVIRHSKVIVNRHPDEEDKAQHE